MKELLPRFIEELQIRNYSARTVTDYGYHLKLWLRFLEQQKISDLQSVTSSTLSSFQRWLYYQPTRRGTVRGILNQNAVLAAVKSFFQFLASEGYVSQDPATAIEYAREPRSLPRNVLTPEEAKRILEAVDTTTALGQRDRTVLEVLYATGIRREELRNLTVGDVNLEEGLLRITLGKGSRDRVVPLGSIASRFLETYLKGIRPHLLGQHQAEWLFISYRGNALDTRTVGNIVKKYASQAGVKKHVTCHVWRHTCASHLIQNNANLRHVQELLGHRSLATTERYLRLTITDLKQAHSKFHPREQE